jgi:hypothetical protein
VASGPPGKGTGVSERSRAGVAVVKAELAVVGEGSVGVGVVPGITITGVDVVITIDSVPTGVGSSDSMDELVPVQALTSTKETRATQAGCEVVGWIFLWRRPILRDLTICLPTMLDAQDDYETLIVINLVDDATVTYADAPFVFTTT